MCCSPDNLMRSYTLLMRILFLTSSGFSRRLSSVLGVCFICIHELIFFSWQKNFNCCLKDHLYEVEVDFNNINREYILEIGDKCFSFTSASTAVFHQSFLIY